MIKSTNVYDEMLLITQSNGIPPPFSFSYVANFRFYII